VRRNVHVLLAILRNLRVKKERCVYFTVNDSKTCWHIGINLALPIQVCARVL